MRPIAELHVRLLRISSSRCLITRADWAASNPEIGDVVEIAPDYVIWRDMNITVRQDANDETRRFAEWLQTDEAAPAFKKYGWTRKGT